MSATKWYIKNHVSKHSLQPTALPIYGYFIKHNMAQGLQVTLWNNNPVLILEYKNTLFHQT